MDDNKSINQKTCDKGMDNIIVFKRDEKSLEEIAEQAFANGDIEKALSVYLEIESLGKYNNIVFQKIADLYTELGMYRESINYWFKYLSVTSKRNYAECYNGLGGNFYLFDQISFSLYYFNLQINDKEDIEFPFDDYMMELYQEQERQIEEWKDNLAKPQIELYDPKATADAQAIYNAKKIYPKEEDKAFELLRGIDKDSDNYSEAQSLIAPLYLLKRDYAKALECFEQAFKDKKYSDLILNDIFAVTVLLGDTVKNQRAFKELKNRQCADYDHLVKYFRFFYELGEHWLNYDYGKMVYELLMPMPNLYFYMGIAALNCRKYQEASQWFSSYYSVTHSYIAEYYKGVADKADSRDVYDFVFSLPDSEMKAIAKTAEKLFSMPIRSLKKKSREIYEFQKAAFATPIMELQAIACQLLCVLNTSTAEKVLKGLLLRFEVKDNVKLIILSLLVKLGNVKSTPLVFGGIYMNIPYERVEFNEEKGDVFMDAYAIAFGRIAPHLENELYKIKISAYEIYYKLLSNGNIKKVNDPTALAGLIVNNIDFVNDDKLPHGLLSYLGTNKTEVRKLIALLKSE